MPDSMPSNRQSLVSALADAIRQVLRHKPRVTVGIDGPDGAGKTTLAHALAEALGDLAIRASIDGFHQPREIRIRQGELSPEGYYRDSFDYDTLHTTLFAPFLAGAPRVQAKVYDYRVEHATPGRTTVVPREAALVFDGVFLLRPELRAVWDISVYLHVSETETLHRVVERDAALFGSVDEVIDRYTHRYLPGQALYRTECDPMTHATVLIDNEVPDAPDVLRWRLDPTPAPR